MSETDARAARALISTPNGECGLTGCLEIEIGRSSTGQFIIHIDEPMLDNMVRIIRRAWRGRPDDGTC